MARLRFRDRRPLQSKMLLLVALGAVTGLALGAVLAGRSGGVDDLEARGRDAKRRPRQDRLEAESPRQPPPHEAELEARVLEVFRNDPSLRGSAIDIGAIGDGVIELTGWVYSKAELKYALTLARGVPDVADVLDSLAVRESASPRVGQAPADR